MSARRAAARKRARDAAAAVVTDVLAQCERDAEDRAAAVATLRSGVDLESLAEFLDILDYGLVLTAQPYEQQSSEGGAARAG